MYQYVDQTCSQATINLTQNVHNDVSVHLYNMMHVNEFHYMIVKRNLGVVSRTRIRFELHITPQIRLLMK